MEIHIYKVKRDISAADVSDASGLFVRESKGWAYNLVMSLFRFPKFWSDTCMRSDEDRKKIRRMVQRAVRQYYSIPSGRRGYKYGTAGEKLLWQAGWRIRSCAVGDGGVRHCIESN